jgi:hypothetical protein
MRKILSFSAIACSGMLMILLNGCMKDKVTHTYTVQRPVYQTLTQARSFIKGEAPISVESPGKVSLYKNYIFLNETSKGIHIIDNTNPSNPRNISFINIPGNTDLSIKNNILYANESYGDLVAIDIQDPEKPVVKKFLPDVFGSYYNYETVASSNPDSILVIKEWISKDTTVNVDPDNPNQMYPGTSCPTCFYLSSSAVSTNGAIIPNPNTVGTNGSLSGFAISGQYLYALAYGSQLNVVDIAAVDDPALTNKLSLTEYTETIYPFENTLFMGGSTGMSIYDLSDPSTPVKKGGFSHITTCDPVITDGNYAYVTLHSGTTCHGAINELDILNVSDLSNPALLKSYTLTSPRGLSKDGNLLFICDGKDGLKIYDASNVNQLSLIKTIGGIETSEVIAQNGKAIVIATDGLYQFDYSDVNNIHQLSKITIHAAGL